MSADELKQAIAGVHAALEQNRTRSSELHDELFAATKLVLEDEHGVEEDEVLRINTRRSELELERTFLMERGRALMAELHAQIRA